MPVKMFICYAHEDEALLNKLKTHLAPLQQQGLIDMWHDRNISAGIQWEQAIIEQFNTAQIILLLVSPDFLASEYCYGTELKRALERHDNGDAKVIPIILRSVSWYDAPFGKLQALPKDAKPITSWRNKDEAFFSVVEGIRQAMKQPHKVEAEASLSKPHAISLGTSHPSLAPLYPTLAIATVGSREAPALNKIGSSIPPITHKIHFFLTSKASLIFKISSISWGASTVTYAVLQAINSNLPNVDVNHSLDTSTFVKYYPAVLALPLSLLVFLAYFLMLLSPAVFALSGVMNEKVSLLLKLSLISLGIGLITLTILTSVNSALPSIAAHQAGDISTFVHYYPPLIAILLITTRDIMDMLVISGPIVFVIAGISYGVLKFAKRSKVK